MNEHVAIHFTEDSGGPAVAILRIRGRLDGETAPTLLERCARVQSSGRHLVLNLSGVTFLGSSGVGALLVLVERFREQSRSIRLAALSQPALTVVELLDLAQYLTIDATEAIAVTSLARAA